MKFLSILLFFSIFLLPVRLSATMEGGDFEIYADTFSILQDQVTAGGNFTIYSTGGEPAGILGRAATGTISSSMAGLDYVVGETFTLSDGVATSTFVFKNFAGAFTGTISNGQFVVDVGGGPSVATMSSRIAQAINVSPLQIDATSDGVETVSLVNTRTSEADGNVPITEAVTPAAFVVTGMSGGGNTGNIFTLRGGFQAMERASLSVDVSPSSVALGQLSLSAVNSSSVVLTVTTDATTGYSAILTEDGNLRKGEGGANDDINDVSDGTVTAGSEEYGISTTGGAGVLAVDTALSGSVTVASNESTATGEETTVNFKAAVGSQSRAGDYTHIVTFTVTANP